MNSKTFLAFKWIFLLIVLFFILFPIFMVINSSLKSTADLYQSPFAIVKDINGENYVNAWIKGSVSRYLLNSIFVTFISVALILVLSSFGAFAISRRETFKRFDKFIYIFFLIGNIVPPQVAIIPIYLQFHYFNLIDSLWGLSIIFMAYGIPFGIFILYWSFNKIPHEIEDSAKIDGCSNFSLYLRIVLPLSKSSLVTVGIFSSVWIWNYFLFPLVLISSDSKKTLPIGLLAFKGRFAADYPSMFAGIVIISLPMILIFLFLQNLFMEGMTAGAVKG